MIPCILLELHGGHIAQGRVKPLLVINTFDEFADRCVGLGQIPMFSSVHLLVFERLHETFGLGIVIRISTRASGGNAAEHSLGADVFVELRPAYTRSVADDLESGALLRIGLRKTPGPC